MASSRSFPVDVEGADRAGLSAATIRSWIQRARRQLPRRAGSLSVAFVTPAVSQRLNRQYRKKDRPTNVLSFRYDEGRGAERVWGELILCPSVIRRESREQHRPYQSYTRFLLQHGLIHLLGLDHVTATEQRRWERWEQRLYVHD